MRVMLAGPIKHWWDVWGSPEHEAYANWREHLSACLVANGHLVYRPHEAFKGEWYGNNGEAFAQRVNDMALLHSEVVINMTPEGTPSDGTDEELKYALKHGKLVLWFPPPADGSGAEAERIARELEAIVARYPVQYNAPVV